MNRLIGIFLILIGIILGFLAGAWLFTNSTLTGPARILGIAVALIVLVVPFVGFGFYLTIQGGGEARQEAEAAQERKLLNIVQSKGQVKIDEVALELQQPKDKIRDLLESLVGLGLFSGYINWDSGVLYSSDASKLREMKKCPNCGGDIELTGKGIAKCRFCGTEFYLS